MVWDAGVYSLANSKMQLLGAEGSTVPRHPILSSGGGCPWDPVNSPATVWVFKEENWTAFNYWKKSEQKKSNMRNKACWSYSVSALFCQAGKSYKCFVAFRIPGLSALFVPVSIYQVNEGGYHLSPARLVQFSLLTRLQSGFVDLTERKWGGIPLPGILTSLFPLGDLSTPCCSLGGGLHCRSIIETFFPISGN